MRSFVSHDLMIFARLGITGMAPIIWEFVYLLSGSSVSTNCLHFSKFPQILCALIGSVYKIVIFIIIGLAQC